MLSQDLPNTQKLWLVPHSRMHYLCPRAPPQGTYQLSRGSGSTGAPALVWFSGWPCCPQSPLSNYPAQWPPAFLRDSFPRDTPALPPTPPHGRFRGRPPTWPCRRAAMPPHSSLTLLACLVVGGGVRRGRRGLVSRWKRHGTSSWGPGNITGRGTKESNLTYSVYLIICSFIWLRFPVSDYVFVCFELFLRRMERNVSKVFPSVYRVWC